jgi:hypothetical protein
VTQPAAPAPATQRTGVALAVIMSGVLMTAVGFMVLAALRAGSARMIR